MNDNIDPFDYTDNYGDRLKVRPDFNGKIEVALPNSQEDNGAYFVDLDETQARNLRNWLNEWLGEDKPLSVGSVHVSVEPVIDPEKWAAATKPFDSFDPTPYVELIQRDIELLLAVSGRLDKKRPTVVILPPPGE